MSSEIASEVAKALTRLADAYLDDLDALADGEEVELECDTDKLEWKMDELRWLAETLLKMCTECGRPLTAAECFEMPEPRPCDECAGHVILSNKKLDAQPFVYDPSDFADLAEFLIHGR